MKQRKEGNAKEYSRVTVPNFLVHPSIIICEGMMWNSLIYHCLLACIHTRERRRERNEKNNGDNIEKKKEKKKVKEEEDGADRRRKRRDMRCRTFSTCERE